MNFHFASFFFTLPEFLVLCSHKRRTFSMDYIVYAAAVHIYFPYIPSTCFVVNYSKSLYKRGRWLKRRNRRAAVVFEVSISSTNQTLRRERDDTHFIFLAAILLFSPCQDMNLFFLRDRFFGAYLIIHIGMLYMEMRL
jgi:hypothetical protein